jgi:RND family efflux transporter MFP subunit
MKLCVATGIDARRRTAMPAGAAATQSRSLGAPQCRSRPNFNRPDMTDQPSPGAAPALSGLRIDRGAPVPARKRRWQRWVVGVAVVCFVAFFALQQHKTTVMLTSVLTAYPSQQYAQLTASGYVVAQRRAAVASKATGRLLELRVREGSVVKKDEILARLDASDIEAGIVASQAGVRMAEAGLRQAEAGLRQTLVEQGNADAELARAKGLLAQNFVSQQAVDAAQRRADAARASAASAQASIAQAQAAVGQAQAQLKVQQVNADYALIRAPFDGVVLVKNANVGDIITPFSSAAGSLGSVVTMADMSTLEVEADVSESNLAKARTGQPVEIVLDALPDTRFRGSVVGIVPTVDRAKATVMMKIRFDKLDPRILPEMSAKVTILSQPATDADQQPVLAVNPLAVVDRDGKKQVLRIKDDTVEAVEVTLGRKLGDTVELRGAIKSGDKLVLSPSAKLVAGDKVEVTTK